MEQTNHGSPSLINIAVLLLFAVVIAVASTVTTYFFLSSKSDEQPAITQLPIVPPAQINIIPTTPPTTQTTVPTDETANWKTYTNNVFRFSFKYPPTFTVKDTLQKNKNSPALMALPGQSLELKDNLQNLYLELWMNSEGQGHGCNDKSYKSAYSNSAGIYVLKEIKYNCSIDGGKVPGQNMVWLWPEINNYRMFIRFTYKENTPNAEILVKTILSTFKFLQ